MLLVQVNGSIMPASVISVYCAYLCYTSLSSEPDDYECNGLHRHSKQVSLSALILGMLTTVLSVVYSAVRAGSSTTFLSPPSSPRSGKKMTIVITSVRLHAWLTISDQKIACRNKESTTR